MILIYVLACKKCKHVQKKNSEKPEKTIEINVGIRKADWKFNVKVYSIKYLVLIIIWIHIFQLLIETGCDNVLMDRIFLWFNSQ